MTGSSSSSFILIGRFPVAAESGIAGVSSIAKPPRVLLAPAGT